MQQADKIELTAGVRTVIGFLSQSQTVVKEAQHSHSTY